MRIKNFLFIFFGFSRADDYPFIESPSKCRRRHNEHPNVINHPILLEGLCFCVAKKKCISSFPFIFPQYFVNKNIFFQYLDDELHSKPFIVPRSNTRRMSMLGIYICVMSDILLTRRKCYKKQQQLIFQIKWV